MAKYRKRPVVIEAVQLSWATWSEMCDFVGDVLGPDNPARFTTEYNDTCGEPGPEYIEFDIPTLEGVMTVRHGDYVIEGVHGELYPCHPDIFHATYEPVDE